MVNESKDLTAEPRSARRLSVRRVAIFSMLTVVLIGVMIGVRPIVRQYRVLRQLRDADCILKTQPGSTNWSKWMYEFDWVDHEIIESTERVDSFATKSSLLPIVVENGDVFEGLSGLRVFFDDVDRSTLVRLFGAPRGTASTDTSEAIPITEGILRNLDDLGLSGELVRDDELAYITGLRHLRQLHLGETSVTDAGLIHLAQLSSLETLEIASNSIKGTGFKHLAGLPNFSDLVLSRSPQVGDEGLAAIGRIPSLRFLILDKTSITDDGLSHLAGLKNLYYVSAYSTSISDIGIDRLAKVVSLERVFIQKTRITDAGLLRLASLPNLQFLNVKETAVSEEGITAFHKARHDAGLPDCELFR